MRAPLTLALAVLLVACDEASIVVAPLDLGVVSVSRRHEATLTVTNHGARPAQLQRLELRSGSVAFTVVPTTGPLAAGASTSWLVRFDSELVGPAEALWRARFDTGPVDFTVRARGALPCVVPTFDVGEARVGQPLERRFPLTNPLDRAAELFVGDAPAPFSVTPSGRVRLAAHETREVVVRFTPRATGPSEVPWRVRPSSDCLETDTSLRGHGLRQTLSFSPGRLDFGAVTQPRTLEVALVNHLSRPVTVTGVTITSPTFESLTPTPLEVPADGRATLQVVATAGPSAELVVTTEDEEVRLPLVADRDGPCVTASRAQLDFADVEVGCQGSDERVSFTNHCPHQVRLQPTVSAGFGLIGGGGVLEAGASAEVLVAAAPRVAGPLQGALSVEVDVLDGVEHLSVPLAVSAAPPEVVTETTTVAASPGERADVLLLIDDTPGMLPIAASVARNLEQLGAWLAANQLDTRVAVMTTSTAPAELGRLRLTAGGAAWLTRPTAQALAAHAALTGTSQSRSSCLEALRAGLQGPAPLQGLPRPETALAIICVTNGPDTIEAAPMSAISEILTALPPGASFSAVARFGTPACGGELERGVLRPLVTLTDGVMEEICTPDWSAALERLGRASFGFSTLFYLHRAPELARAPLKVWVDEVALPEFDQPPFGRIWQWDGAINAVRLEPTYALETGRTLKVQYQPQCPR